MKLFLKTLLALVLGIFLSACAHTDSSSPIPMTPEQAQAIIAQTEDKVSIAKDVWIASGLTEFEYDVLWHDKTERAGTGDLLHEKRTGIFVTKGCKIPVFKSEHKYDSGTGWPTFYEVLDKDNIVLKEDNSLLGHRRIEVESKCGEHLGHVFPDGPQDKTGLRYCINSAALEFIPEKS